MRTRNISLPTPSLNKWFIAAIASGALGSIFLAWGFFKSMGNAHGLGDLHLFFYGLISIPFFLIAIGTGICGQIERLMDAQRMVAESQPAPMGMNFQMNATKPCSFCAEPIPGNATVCPVCGNRQ